MSRPAHHNITPIGPNTDPAQLEAMMMANTVAVQLNNEGNLARKRGELDRALALHREALALKIRGFGEESVQAANSFNTLGETCLRKGMLDDAEGALRKALRVRDDKAGGGLEMGPRGDMDGARAVRLRGGSKGMVICGSDSCVTPGGALLSESQRKACGACRAVFYCGAACQKNDWTSRHKPFCKAYAASKKAKEGSAAASGS